MAMDVDVRGVEAVLAGQPPVAFDIAPDPGYRQVAIQKPRRHIILQRRRVDIANEDKNQSLGFLDRIGS